MQSRAKHDHPRAKFEPLESGPRATPIPSVWGCKLEVGDAMKVGDVYAGEDDWVRVRENDGLVGFVIGPADRTCAVRPSTPPRASTAGRWSGRPAYGREVVECSAAERQEGIRLAEAYAAGGTSQPYHSDTVRKIALALISLNGIATEFLATEKVREVTIQMPAPLLPVLSSREKLVDRILDLIDGNEGSLTRRELARQIIIAVRVATPRVDSGLELFQDNTIQECVRGPVRVEISGPQGSGKTTLALVLKRALLEYGLQDFSVEDDSASAARGNICGERVAIVVRQRG